MIEENESIVAVEDKKMEPQKKEKKTLRSMIIIIALVVLIIGIVGVIVFSKREKNNTPTQAKVYHVGILSGLNLFKDTAVSFKKEMTNLGYVENNNIVYDVQQTNYEQVKEKKILQTFVHNNVDLIFAYNTDAAIEAKEATKVAKIPVVFANAFIEDGKLVSNSRVPGGNITGVRYPNTDVAVKRLEVLHEIVPQAKRFWVPYQKGYPSAELELEVIRPAAKELGINLIEFPAENLTSLKAELEKRSHSGDIGFDAVLFIPESLSTTKEAFITIANYTKKQKIPIAGSSVSSGNYSTLFAVTVNNEEVGKLAARIAAEILKGDNAGNIPIVAPETYLIINYKIAKELGIQINDNILNQANKIIQ